MPEKKRNPFKLREFRGVASAVIEKLAVLGIKTSEQMLAAGAPGNNGQLCPRLPAFPKKPFWS